MTPQTVPRLVEQGDDEGDDRDEQERVPDREREVGDPDVAVPDVRELVADDRPERRRVGRLLDDEPAAERDAVAAGWPKARPPADASSGFQKSRGGSQPLLARQLRDLFDRGRRVLRGQRSQLRRRVIQSGVASMIAAATSRSAAVPPSIHQTW